MRLIITAPRNIRGLIGDTSRRRMARSAKGGEKDDSLLRDQEDVSVITTVIEDMEPDFRREGAVVYVSNNLLYTAVWSGPAISILNRRKTIPSYGFASMAICGETPPRKIRGPWSSLRLKAFAMVLHIAERMKPQDGSVEAVISKRKFKLRLATTSTPNGESLIIRMLEPSAKPKPLSQLGMTDAQVRAMKDFSTPLRPDPRPRSHRRREDDDDLQFPVPFWIRRGASFPWKTPSSTGFPTPNQQQVNERAGVTFEALLKSSVRQDPDILYLGEIRTTSPPGSPWILRVPGTWPFRPSTPIMRLRPGAAGSDP